MSSAVLSPDQTWAFELKSSLASNQTALNQLKPGGVTPDELSKAKLEVSGAIAHIKKAASVAPATIGASDDEIAASVQQAQTLDGQAAKALSSKSYDTVRKSLALAMGATKSALKAFGVPLASDFRVVANFRPIGNFKDWEGYIALSAKAPGMTISKIVIGLAGRETANAAEPGGLRRAPSLPVTKLAIYTLQKPSGEYNSGWGNIVNGVIVCKLNPTMAKDESFAINFQPIPPPGTKFLVKFQSTDGKRGYAVITAR
jgi:hypothetical protein